MLRLPADLNEERVCVAAAARGLAVQGTRAMYGGRPAPDGLLVSYSRAPAGVLNEAVNRLAAACHSVRHDVPGTTGSTLTAGMRPATALDYF